MRSIFLRLSALGVLTALVWACGPGYAEQVAVRRGRYQATVNGWVVDQKPRGETVERSIALDVLVTHDSPEPLPGLTLDLSHLGPDRKEKRHWREWISTEGLAPGAAKQVSLHLDGAGYAPGDLFQAAVRDPIPAAERPQYREFSRSAGGPG
jgi:hypothetical protein